MPEFKYEIPEGIDPTRCRGCRALIWWVKTPKGKNMPVDKDGVPHWSTCPKSDRFKGYDPAEDPLRPGQRQDYEQVKQKLFRMNEREQGFMVSMDAKFRNGQRLTKGEAAYLHKLWEDRR